MNERNWLAPLLAPLLISTLAESGCKGDDEPRDAPMPGSGGSSSSGGSNEGGSLPPLGGETNTGGLPQTGGVCEGIVCGQNQGCFDDEGSATCECLSGFSGPGCTDVDECAAADRCGEAGTCKNFEGTFACTCEAGAASGADGACADIDECEDGPSSCDEDASCTDTEGSHVCTCEPGLFGDGTFCKEADACAEAPCGEGTCRNTPSGYACACPIGTSGPNCASACPMDDAINFASAILEAAVRSSTGIVGDITPNKLSSHTGLYAPPPDPSLVTEDEIRSLDGLECWPTLESISLAGHGVEDVEALEHLAALETLDLTCTEAADLSPLGNLPVLRTLDLGKGSLCTDNQRDTLSLDFLENLTSLRELDLEAAGYVENLAPLANLKRLEKLNLRGTDLGTLAGASALVQLRELRVSQNPISDLSPLASHPRLRVLHLAGGEVDDISNLAGITTLEDVDLSHNALSDIGALGNLAELKFLDLAGNEVVDLDPLGSLEHLILVDLSDNLVLDLSPLAHNLSLSGGTVWLTGNEFSCDDAEADLLALTTRGITVHDDCD